MTIPLRQLSARILIPVLPSHAERYLQIRRKRYARRLLLMGVRPASIERYLIRGFPSGFARACRREMQRLVWDIEYRRRLA